MPKTQEFSLFVKVRKIIIEPATLLLMPSKQIQWGGDVKGADLSWLAILTVMCYNQLVLHEIKPMDLLRTGAMLLSCSVTPGYMGLIVQTQNFSAKTYNRMAVAAGSLT